MPELQSRPGWVQGRCKWAMAWGALDRTGAHVKYAILGACGAHCSGKQKAGTGSRESRWAQQGLGHKLLQDTTTKSQTKPTSLNMPKAEPTKGVIRGRTGAPFHLQLAQGCSINQGRGQQTGNPNKAAYWCHDRFRVVRESPFPKSNVRLPCTPSPPIKSLGFRGFDSSRLLILRGGNFHDR